MQCIFNKILPSYFAYCVAGDAVSLFGGVDHSSKSALVEYRVKNLAYACLLAIYENRYVCRSFSL